ncbi:MAG: lipopolysaccharide biosynthesis protein [Fibrobacteria bacterium]|nr:lipopolysaccharide biosynthesis protein [Fibrobacteria bacterium]
MKRLAGNFLWSAFGKLLDAIFRFVSVPLVLHHYGKSDFGLTALASSINIFLQIADFGMNVGAIKLLSESLGQKDSERTGRIVHSGMALYTGIGAVNILVLTLIGSFCDSWFGLDPDQSFSFRCMLGAMGAYSLLNWTFAIFRQMVMAAGRLGWDERNSLLASSGSFLLALAAINFGWTIQTYYAATLIALTIPIAIRVRWCLDNVEGATLGWKWDRSTFAPALATSGIMLAIALVQSLANNARPFLLANQSGIQSVTDYRVIQQIATLVVLVGGSLFNAIYPEVSRLIAERRMVRVGEFAKQGTKILLYGYLFTCGAIAAFSRDILMVYLGESYVHLWLDLSIWSLTVLTGHAAILSSIAILDSYPITLLYFSLVSCILSLGVTYGLASHFGVSSAVWGYAIYAFLQISFYYVYYSPRQGVVQRSQYLRYFLAPLAFCLSILSVQYYLVEILKWASLWTGVLALSVFSAYLGIEIWSDAPLKSLLEHSQMGKKFVKIKGRWSF